MSGHRPAPRGAAKAGLVAVALLGLTACAPAIGPGGVPIVGGPTVGVTAAWGPAPVWGPGWHGRTYLGGPGWGGPRWYGSPGWRGPGWHGRGPGWGHGWRGDGWRGGWHGGGWHGGGWRGHDWRGPGWHGRGWGHDRRFHRW